MKQNRKKHINQIISAIAIAMSLSSPVWGQLHTPELPENKTLILAEQQFYQGHYALALQSAQKYVNQRTLNTNMKETDLINKASFFSAVSALKLDLAGCEDTAVKTINTTSNPAYKQRTAFALAQY